MFFHINQNHRDAICCQYRQQQLRDRANQPVPNQGLLWNCLNTVNEIGVDLPHVDQWPRLFSRPGPKCFQKNHAVSLDRSAGILFGKTQVESIAPIGPGSSAQTGAESVDKPGNGG
jgi:hypothetical protein